MRTIITLLIFILGVSFILFLKITSDSALRVFRYVGVDYCKGCHSVIGHGNQYGAWHSSRHSKATAVLNEEKAMKYTRQSKISDPMKNPFCLKCHTTAYGEAGDRFEESFNNKDGIQCEECHNPGSEYAKFEVMILHTKFLSNGGDPGNKFRCLKCHSPNIANKKFEKCPFQTQNFDLKTSFEKIKHPVTK